MENWQNKKHIFTPEGDCLLDWSSSFGLKASKLTASLNQANAMLYITAACAGKTPSKPRSCSVGVFFPKTASIQFLLF